MYDILHPLVERKQALEQAKEEVNRARQQLAIIQDSWHQSRVTTDTIRSLNRVFVAIMEGSLTPQLGDERFSQFLIECARHSSRVPWQFVDVLSLYISLRYGDPNMPRAISFAFARRRGIFPDDVARSLQENEADTHRTREEFQERHVKRKLDSIYTLADMDKNIRQGEQRKKR